MLLKQEQMTPEEYLDYAEQHADVHFDFMDGELIEVSPKPLHGRTQTLIAYAFESWLRNHPLDRKWAVYTEVLHVLEGMKFQPDVSINPPSEANYFTEPPLIAVEIRSDSQSRESQRRKARAYIERGTPLVLLVFAKEGIEVYRPGHDPVALTLEDTLTGYDILPGFSVPVKELFP
jgi:Uma2 family endonuclease